MLVLVHSIAFYYVTNKITHFSLPLEFLFFFSRYWHFWRWGMRGRDECWHELKPEKKKMPSSESLGNTFPPVGVRSPYFKRVGGCFNIRSEPMSHRLLTIKWGFTTSDTSPEAIYCLPSGIFIFDCQRVWDLVWVQSKTEFWARFLTIPIAELDILEWRMGNGCHCGFNLGRAHELGLKTWTPCPI